MTRAIYRVHRELETLATGRGEIAIALCDRGTIDGVAYWPAEAATTARPSALGTTTNSPTTQPRRVGGESRRQCEVELRATTTSGGTRSAYDIVGARFVHAATRALRAPDVTSLACNRGLASYIVTRLTAPLSALAFPLGAVHLGWCAERSVTLK